ncbi:MAG: ROK family protein [Acidimicrobiia bacterium]|nr:ROK family protein [Acidimicrobiia bacterium]
MTVRFGIDIGGSGIKGAPVDLDNGELAADRHRIRTPQPAKPRPVMEVAAAVVAHHGWDGPVGCAFPAIVQHGVVLSAANVDDEWIGVDGAALLADIVGHETALLNDADAAGLAEMRYGAGRDQRGVVMTLTFGTGIGSGMFVDGVLVPNSELGHLELDGEVAEDRAAARLVERDDMDLSDWLPRVDRYLGHLERLFSPDLFIFGGGISKRFDEFAGAFTTRAPVVPAKLRNQAGIVGAALAAYERFG